MRRIYVVGNSCLYFSFVNPFIPNAPFPHLLKTSENRQGVEKVYIKNKQINWFFQAVVPNQSML